MLTQTDIQEYSCVMEPNSCNLSGHTRLCLIFSATHQLFMRKPNDKTNNQNFIQQTVFSAILVKLYSTSVGPITLTLLSKVNLRLSLLAKTQVYKGGEDGCGNRLPWLI